MEVEQIIGRIRIMMKSILATSTLTVYKRAWALFKHSMEFLSLNHISMESFPIQVNHVLFYLGFMQYKGFAPATLTTYVSAISYIHKILEVQDPTSSFLVQKLLASCNKLNPRSDSRLPITFLILHRLMEAIKHTSLSIYHMSLIRTMYIMGFFGLLRIGEMTIGQNKRVVIYKQQVEINDGYVKLKISHFKHNKSLKPVELILPAQVDKSICPVENLRKYLILRGNHSGPLFCFKDGTPVSRQFFTNQLKINISFCGLNPHLYQSHSLRIGGASYYAELGMSDSQIRLIGRWNSDAFKRYIRCQKLMTAVKKSTNQ